MTKRMEANKENAQTALEIITAARAGVAGDADTRLDYVVVFLTSAVRALRTAEQLRNERLRKSRYHADKKLKA